VRRPIRHKAQRASHVPSTMSRELDWLVDQWQSSRPEERLQIVLAKIRAEERLETPDRVHKGQKE
jgi:septum formation topological specificity factor MinE